MLKVILWYLVISCCSFPVAHGDFLCYSCIMDASAKDRSCVNNPAAVTTSTPIVKCPYKYCTIIRQEYLEYPGQIHTFYRGCTANSYQGVLDGGGYRVYTRLCTTSLCNDWDGISSGPSGGSGGGGAGGGGSGGGGGGGGGSSINDPGNSDVLVVDGIGNRGARNQQGDLYFALILVGAVMKLYM